MTEPGASGGPPPRLGRYELITRIGQGGMAEVQLALQRGPAGFEKLVVVKLVHENLASQKAFVDMLLDEARVAALVKHPNVVDIYDLGVAEGRYFIAMEYLEGEPLLAVLRAGRDGQRLDVMSTARLIADTAEGLDAAHELRSMAGDPIELVHHDVSLGNIVVLYNGQVKLVDFGVAKASHVGPRTTVQGKFGYMAPEKLRGGAGDRRSDIWSLGCVLWEALTLRRLFKGGNDSDTMHQVLESRILAPSLANRDVPVDFDPIALRALDRDPANRYPTAKAMASDLEEVLRKHGYAAKNDMIARYMQETFRSHIAARKKLLQEVSSKGRASPDVLEAAFNDSAMASGSPVPSPGELSGLHARPDSDSDPQVVIVSAAEPAPLSSTGEHARRIEPRVAPASAGPGDEATEIAPPPIMEEAGVRGRRSARALVGDAVSAMPQRRPTIRYIALGGAVLALVVIASVLLGTGGEDAASARGALEPVLLSDSAAAAPSATPPPSEPSPASAPGPKPDAGATKPAATEPPGAERPQIEMEGDAAPSRRATAQPHPPRSGSSARPAPDRPSALSPDELFKAGLQAWVRGDSRAALAAYKRVIQANPGYAAAWRGVGLVYEKLGDKTAARAAFQKYLQLAPSAADAAGIRARLESR